MTPKLEDLSWKFTDNREWLAHMSKWPPVIISCAITGGSHNKEAHPGLPQSPEEQADAAYEAYKAGATLVHLHARSPRSNYYDGTIATAEDYYRVNKLVRERCPDIIINNTGSVLSGFEEEDMNTYLRTTNPEACSLNVAMLYTRSRFKIPKQVVEEFGGAETMEKKSTEHTFIKVLPSNEIVYEGVAPWGYTQTERLARAMKANHVKPELEVFNSQSFWFIDNLLEQKLLEPPYWCQLVFGMNGATSPSSVTSALNMIDSLPPKSMFSAIGVGALQLPMSYLSLIMGGHVRVGMEDNIYYRHGELVKSNAQMVERAVRIIHELNREVATPTQTREMLGVDLEPKQYP